MQPDRKSPLISAVLPSRNGARYLASSIESILAQTYRNFELILVDDGSMDSTPQIMRKYAEADSRVRFEPNPTNLRLPLSLNRGFAFARGEWLTWTSDDNLYLPTAFERLITTALTTDADVVYADMQNMDDGGAVTGPGLTGEPVDMWAGNPVGACFLYRKEVQESLGGYDDSMRLAEDYDFFLRASTRFKFHHLREVLYLYRLHSGALTSTHQHLTGKMADLALERSLKKMTWLGLDRQMEGRFRLGVLGWKRRDWCQVARQLGPILFDFPRAGRVILRKWSRRSRRLRS